MFTCSSCGYEANPDSAPACSLCGTKRPVKAGEKAETPKPAPAPAAASAAASAPAAASASSAKAEPKRAAAAKKGGDDMDELASAAQAVADSATSMPAVTSAGARGGRPAAGQNQTVVTTTGILRMSAPAPPIENALTLMGTFIGALLGYAFMWYRIGAAPASLGQIALPAIVAIIAAGIARLVVAPALEESLTYNSKVSLHGPVAGATGAAIAVFALVGFFAASRAAPGREQQAGNAVVVDGSTLAQRVALMTPWTVTLKTEKVVVLGWKGKPELRLSTATLSADEIASFLKATALTRADLDRLLGPDPSGGPVAPLPAEFSTEVFLDRLGTIYGVLKDQPRPKEQRVGMLLVRRRRNGVDDFLSLPSNPRSPAELQPALPQGVPAWIGVSLGIPHDSTSDHDALVGAAFDKFRPSD